ncbi:MAG: hypothetical protein IRY99_17285, partial [Isosphaeraceae bacterium]|nr:hypothetical protein [Isosphaeraceae bacterium]
MHPEAHPRGTSAGNQGSALVRAAVVRLAALLALAPVAAGAAEPRWPMGQWRVVTCGLGLDAPLDRLEVRAANRMGDAIVIASKADEQGQQRVWGSGKLGPVTAGEARVEWVADSIAVRLQLRPEGASRLSALVRQRDRPPPPPRRAPHPPRPPGVGP